MIQFRNVFHNPFPGNSEVTRMVELGGELYIAAGGSNPKVVSVYWLDHAGCKIWKNITPNWKPSPGTYSLAMAGFKGELYIGTDAGQVYRIVPNTWATPLPVQLQGFISSMFVFNSELYAMGSFLHSTSDGIKWGDLGPLKVLGPNEITDGAGQLAAFKGHLYYGVGISKYDNTTPWKKIAQGIEIWRSPDGRNWNLFKSVIQDLTVPFSDPAPQHVHAMKEFNGCLYIGEYEGYGGSVFRTDGSPGSWGRYPAMPNGLIRALEVHDGLLYAGWYVSSGNAAGVPLLYCTSNGINWSVVPGSPVGATQTGGVVSMASVGGKLYFGTADTGKGGEVYEMGDPVSQCKIADIYGLSKKTIFNMLKLKIRDLSDAKLVSASSTKETLQGVEHALAELCVDRSARVDIKKALGYLRLVQRELDTLSYYTDFAGRLEDMKAQQLALRRATDYGERALRGYELYLAALEDVEMSIRE